MFSFKSSEDILKLQVSIFEKQGLECAQLKKKRKFSSYLKKFWRNRVQNHVL